MAFRLWADRGPKEFDGWVGVVLGVTSSLAIILLRKRELSFWINLAGPFQGGASFVNPFCYLCFMFVFVMLSCLFLAALWSPAGNGLASWLFCVLFSCVMSLSHTVSRVIVHIDSWSLPSSLLLLWFASIEKRTENEGVPQRKWIKEEQWQ